MATSVPDAWCRGCGKHCTLLTPFGGAGDPLNGDFNGQYLVKTWRDCGGSIGSSWECRDCIVLSDEEIYAQLNKLHADCPACTYFDSCIVDGESWNEAMCRVRKTLTHTCLIGGTPRILEPWTDEKRMVTLEETFASQLRSWVMMNYEKLPPELQTEYQEMLTRFERNGLFTKIGEGIIIGQKYEPVQVNLTEDIIESAAETAFEHSPKGVGLTDE